MGTITWGADVAEAYDVTSAAMYRPDVLEPTVDLLVELARGGPALEFAIGTGRVALPLMRRGIEVHGIELSPGMVDQLRKEAGAGIARRGKAVVGALEDRRPATSEDIRELKSELRRISRRLDAIEKRLPAERSASGAGSCSPASAARLSCGRGSRRGSYGLKP